MRFVVKMRFVVLNIALFLAVGVVAAQNANPANANPADSAAKKIQTVRGCLSQTGDTYVLLGGNPIRQYRVLGGNIKPLKHQLGHTVEITGPVGEVESGASTNGMYGPGSTTGVGYNTIRADSVKEAYGNCG